MELSEVLTWFEQHPDIVHGDLNEVLMRCERTVRRHAREAAWVAAKDYVKQRREDEKEHHGAPASEAYVARHVCHQLADELIRHEPSFEPSNEEKLAGGSVKSAVGGAGWEVLVPWILEMAREEEHRTWLEIAHYTDKRAKELIREHHLSDDNHFDHTKCYGELAQLIERLLEADYLRQAFPH
jgi:hypothetical protein